MIHQVQHATILQMSSEKFTIKFILVKILSCVVFIGGFAVFYIFKQLPRRLENLAVTTISTVTNTTPQPDTTPLTNTPTTTPTPATAELICPEYHTKINQTYCQKHICTCDHGTPEESFCDYHLQTKCLECQEFYHLQVIDDTQVDTFSNSCFENICYCPNGKPVDQCLHNRHVDCQFCDPGFELEERIIKFNAYTRSNDYNLFFNISSALINLENGYMDRLEELAKQNSNLTAQAAHLENETIEKAVELLEMAYENEFNENLDDRYSVYHRFAKTDRHMWLYLVKMAILQFASLFL